MAPAEDGRGQGKGLAGTGSLWFSSCSPHGAKLPLLISFLLPFFLAHLSPFPSGILPCPLPATSLPLFLGQELLICNSIGAKCFAKLLKQPKATG